MMDAAGGSGRRPLERRHWVLAVGEDATAAREDLIGRCVEIASELEVGQDGALGFCDELQAQ